MKKKESKNVTFKISANVLQAISGIDRLIKKAKELEKTIDAINKKSVIMVNNLKKVV